MWRIKSKFEEKTFEPLCSFSVKKYQLNIAKKKKKNQNTVGIQTKRNKSINKMYEINLKI